MRDDSVAVGALTYCAGGGARTRLLAAAAAATGLVSRAGAGAGDTDDSTGLADAGWDVTFDIDRFALAVYPELREFIVSLLAKEGVAEDGVDDSRSTGGMVLACS